MTLERAVADYEARWEEHRAELAKTRQRSSELELRVLAQRNAYVQSATDELKEISTRLFDLEERLRPSKDAADRQRIAAPIAGVVVGLRVFSAGAVVGPREVLMEIVPEDKTPDRRGAHPARGHQPRAQGVGRGSAADRLQAAHHAAGGGHA